jgi:hypothetical protein
MNARESRFRIIPVIVVCLALLGTAAVFAAQIDKSAAKGSFIEIHNPNAVPGAGGAHRPFTRQGFAATDTCSGSCNCDTCGCYGTFDCCAAGCGACFLVACGAT